MRRCLRAFTPGDRLCVTSILSGEVSEASDLSLLVFRNLGLTSTSSRKLRVHTIPHRRHVSRHRSQTEQPKPYFGIPHVKIAAKQPTKLRIRSLGSFCQMESPVEKRTNWNPSLLLTATRDRGPTACDMLALCYHYGVTESRGETPVW